MNNPVRNWSSDYCDARLAQLRKLLSVLLVTACAPAATLKAQTVATLISSNLFEPHSVATDGVNAYVTDASNNRIVKFDLTKSNLTTLAGLTGPTNVGYANGQGASALFNQPLGIVAARGGLVVVDSGNHLIRFVTTSGATAGTVSLIAGTYIPNSLGGFANGIGTSAQFTFPTAIAADAAGNLYVADTGNKAIRKIDTTPTNNVTTITTNFNAPEAVALDNSGNLWVADTGNNSICVISNVATASTVYTIANAAHLSGGKDSLNAAFATFNFPSGLLWTTNMSSLLISDTHNNTIRNLFFTNGNWAVQTIAGMTGVTGQTDGSPLSATFDNPVGLALDLHDGNNFYYVVDRSSASNGTVRLLQPSVLPQLIPGPPSITITAPSNNFVAIQPASVPITVTSSDTNLNGSVTNIQILTNNVVIASNSAATSYSLNNPSVGTIILTAIATDNYGLSATSAPVSIKIIAPLTPNISIILPTNSSLYTKPAFITIVVTDSDPNTPYDPAAGIGSVVIQANGTNIPVIAQPSNTFQWNNPAVGQYSLTAIANESPFQLAATSAPVNISVLGVQQPIVSIINPAPGTFFAPTNITINVSAIDPNTNGINAVGQISGVTLYNGTNLLPANMLTYLGQTQPGIYTFIFNNPPATSASNYSLIAVATDSVFQVSGTSAPVNITVTLPPPPPPVFTPNFGYFPFCQTINITETAPGQIIQNIFYTTDGTAPTTNSLSVTNLTGTNGNYTGSIEWCDTSHDLTGLQMIAFNGVVGSPVAVGTTAPTNQIGFVRSVTNGPGATVIMPIVVDLKSNGVLGSLQFRAEVTPSGGNPTAISSVTLLPLSTNDFVPLVGPGAANTTVTFETVAYPTTNNGQGLLISAAGASSGFSINNFGVVGLLAVQIPTNAVNGQTYQLNVLFPSGTSDAQQTQVGMVSKGGQVLTVETVQYFEGDSSPGSGYNAGEFGDGILNAADVNNALYASVGIRVPYPFSDAYNAMDTYPETATELGDGFITYLDWQHILFRSEGLETNNWVRFWTNGVRTHRGISWSPSSPPTFVGVTPDPIAPKSGKGGTPHDLSALPGFVWMRQAAVGAGSVANVSPGSTISVPLYAKVQPGSSLTGLQFRATMVGDNGAPEPGAIQFTPATGFPAPASQLPGLGPNDIVCAWDLGAFAIPLQGSNFIGSITFKVPVGTQAGQTYSLHFSGVDGSPDPYTLYQLESFPGTAWVLSAALQPPQITSDEWRTAFFGSYTNVLAADNADPDGDGALNWQEYVAGTNPNNALSRLQFSGIALGANQTGPATLSWLTAPGKTYLLESTPALSGASWSVVNTNVGDGNMFQFSPNAGGGARFYRLSVQPQ